MVTCEGCGDSIEAETPATAQRVAGWAVNRRQGGTNAVALPERQPRWLCRFCLDKRRQGIALEQLSLFPE